MGQSCVLVEWKGALHEKLKLLKQKAEEERASREGLGAFARSLCIVILALILIQVAQI